MTEKNKQSDTRAMAEIVESTMAEFKEAMRLREELSIRIGKRTSQIIRFGTLTVALLSIAIVYLTSSLNRDMARMLTRMDEIALTMNSMERQFVQVAGHTSGMNGSVAEMNQAIQTMPEIAHSVTVMSGEVQQMKQQMHYLNGNVGAMGYEVNRMAAPVRMFPLP